MPTFMYIGGPEFGWHALAYKTANDQTGSGASVITFDSEISDVPGIHSVSVDTSRFTIPASWSGRYGLLKGGVQCISFSETHLYGRKNGASFMGSGRFDLDSGGTPYLHIKSAPVVLATNDYFDLYADNATGLTASTSTWGSFELLPASFSGALVHMSSGQAISAGTTTVLNFGSEASGYDLNNYHDNSTNNSRLTTQSGETLAILYGCAASGNVTGQLVVDMIKTGASVVGLPRADTDSSGNDYVPVQSAVIAVTGGTDYFQLRAFHTSATTIDAGNHTWFAIRALPSDTEYVLLQLTADEDVGTGAYDPIVWDAEVADTSGFWASGASVEIPAGKDGWYEFSANIAFASATDRGGAKFQIDGADFYGMAECKTDTAGTDAVNIVSAPRYLAAGQTVSVAAIQNSGGDVVSGDNTWFCVRKIKVPTS